MFISFKFLKLAWKTSQHSIAHTKRRKKIFHQPAWEDPRAILETPFNREFAGWLAGYGKNDKRKTTIILHLWWWKLGEDHHSNPSSALHLSNSCWVNNFAGIFEISEIFFKVCFYFFFYLGKLKLNRTYSETILTRSPSNFPSEENNSAYSRSRPTTLERITLAQNIADKCPSRLRWCRLFEQEFFLSAGKFTSFFCISLRVKQWLVFTRLCPFGFVWILFFLRIFLDFKPHRSTSTKWCNSLVQFAFHQLWYKTNVSALPPREVGLAVECCILNPLQRRDSLATPALIWKWVNEVFIAHKMGKPHRLGLHKCCWKAATEWVCVFVFFSGPWMQSSSNFCEGRPRCQAVLSMRSCSGVH